MTKPTIGQQGWGEALNAHLDTLLPTATASATYQAGPRRPPRYVYQAVSARTNGGAFDQGLATNWALAH